MSDLVKTGGDIANDLFNTLFNELDEDFRRQRDEKFLVLPFGLDVLEEMLKKEIEQVKVRQCEPFPPIEDDTYEYGSFDSLNHVLEMISSVFARFKQDIGLVNTEGKKKENRI